MLTNYKNLGFKIVLIKNPYREAAFCLHTQCHYNLTKIYNLIRTGLIVKTKLSYKKLYLIVLRTTLFDTFIILNKKLIR